ncbi:MAG TPA: hypothetical protein VFE82_08465 [Ramlibacter sp.]|jgi:hypothetical protein|uniref:hypothetical protein n=1 Tax=Ramlibacter sp. TaxID=1917967 RepID=UPI002D2F0432|nr:hypothetical protein [Ramlibacter sp.]HZY18501.1 hypothetical protein [Ramlibacter sp.]
MRNRSIGARGACKRHRPLGAGRSRWAAVLLAAVLLAAGPAPAQDVAVPPTVRELARDIAAELAVRCPLADANDAAAFDHCRAALQGGRLRGALPQVVLWGRTDAAPGATLQATALTQLAPDTWASLYAPLFMFNGRHAVRWVAQEGRFLIRLEAAFRNRLAPGQFPYPFWHEESKWAAYENTSAVLLWLEPASSRIDVAQFAHQGPLLQTVRPVRHPKHDGQWLWTDRGGRTQPAVTLFEGLYRPENPYLRALDRQYRDLALQLRESQCQQCHVPSNPGRSQRLVLLSSPAHAAGEIDRLIRAVREDRMPVDRNRRSFALSAPDKAWLLGSAEAFRATVQAARRWEQQASEAAQPTVWRPTAPQAAAAAAAAGSD